MFDVRTAAVNGVNGIGHTDTLLRTCAAKGFFDKPPASCCITHGRTFSLPPSRKEERRTKENKGVERSAR